MSKQHDPIEQARTEHDNLVADVRYILKDSRARNVLWHILGICGIYDDTFTGNSQTFYREGMRRVGLDTLQLIDEADPSAYARLILEKLDERTES